MSLEKENTVFPGIPGALVKWKKDTICGIKKELKTWWKPFWIFHETKFFMRESSNFLFFFQIPRSLNIKIWKNIIYLISVMNVIHWIPLGFLDKSTLDEFLFTNIQSQLFLLNAIVLLIFTKFSFKYLISLCPLLKILETLLFLT